MTKFEIPFKIEFMKLFLLIILLSFSANATTAIEDAVTAAGIRTTDSLDLKIDKTLRLLNEKRYFNPKDDSAKDSPYENPYELDSKRSAEEILSQKIGGSCGSTALAFAAILVRSGLDQSKIRIVASVVNKDLEEICPKAGAPRVIASGNGASGHVFVALQFPDGKWQIINSIDGSRNYERAPWFDPTEVQRLIKHALQIPTDVYKKLPPKVYASGLTVFQSWSLKEVPIHSFQQRFDLIASGHLSISPGVCRFTAP